MVTAGPTDGRRCAALAHAVGEPLAGSAPVAARWVCLEHRGSWPRDIAEHPDAVVRAFCVRAAAAGWTPLLIRRPGRRDARGPARLLFADPDAGRTTVLTVEGPSELDDVALPGAPPPGRPHPDPLLLVCTHGRRDRCCAVDGRALALAVVAAGEPDVWECSHLGGHRFAPTALVLPTGYLYGRLDPATAVAARKAAGTGEMEPTLCRGRSTLPPAGQVAELAVRQATGLRGVDALAVSVRHARPVRVVARDGRAWDVDVVEQPGPTPRPASCGIAALGWTAPHAAAVRPVSLAESEH